MKNVHLKADGYDHNFIPGHEKKTAFSKKKNVLKKFNILGFQVVKSGHIIEEPPIHICKAKSQGDILLCLSPSYSLHRVPQTKPAFPGMRMTGEKPFIDLNLFLLSAEFCGKSSSHSRVYFSRLKEGCVDKGLETTCCSMLKH